MKIKYITTDLQLESTVNLNPIVKEMDETLSHHFHGWVDRRYRVALAGPGDYDEPEETIRLICDDIEKLSEE